MKKLIIVILLLALCSCTQTSPDVDDSLTIGFIGCSNTRETVEGYHYVGGTKMWDYERHYGSGTLLDWSRDVDDSTYWNVFDKLLKKYPNTKTIWLELCIMDKERTTSYEHANIILNEIRKRIPSVVIYVSALAEYTDGVCEITGTWGLEKGKELVQEIDLKNQDVFLGPILGPMSAKETAKDGCHLSSPDGKRKLGTQLKDFFDGLDQVQQTIEPETASILGKSEISALPEIEKPEFEQPWQDRVNAALAESDCPPKKKLDYPDDYYQGKLTDTHLHIPSIPDWSPYDEPNTDELEGRFGGPGAFLGWNVKMSEIACTIQHEETTKNFAFFPVYDEDISEYQLYLWKKTMELYPNQFTPFIMSSGNDGDPDGFPTVDAKTLKSMLAVYPELFEGYGEIGLYARENGGSPELPPDSQRLQEIYPIIAQNKLAVYFHLGDGHKDNFERILKANPDINFVWHGDQLSMDEIEDVLSNNKNAYYGIEAYQEGSYEIFPLFVGKSKSEYLNAMEKYFDGIVSAAVRTWKPFVERHPDQVLWGTDRGDAAWNYDVDASQMMVKFARAFIGKIEPSVQEKIAYKNAEKIVGGTT